MSEIVKPLISEFLFKKADRLKVPLSGALEISPICNMDCKMCYIKMTKDEVNKKGRLRRKEEWISLASQAKEAGTLFLLITGGEPFLHKDIKEIYIELYRMGFSISINTNATLIDNEVIEWLRKYPPMRVNVTLYGASNETYKRLCNNPRGFDQATRGIELLKKANIPVKINVSLTPYNSADLEGIFKYGKDNQLMVHASSYMFPPLRRDKSSIGHNDRFTPTESAKQHVNIQLLRMGKEKFINIYNNNININTNTSIINDTCECGEIEGDRMKCRAGLSTFWITWDGRMLACGMMDNPVSYPFKEGFITSWEKIINQTEKIRMPIECSKCKIKDECKPCAARVVTETGGLLEKPIYVCNRSYSIIEETKKLYDYLVEK